MSSPTILPHVDHIQGVHLQPGASAADSQLSVQYTDRTGKLYQLLIPLLDAMYLRNVLNDIEKKSAFGPFDKPLSN